MKWIKNIIYNYTVTLETGMHIGGLKDAVEIGGIDSPVIKIYRKYNIDGEEKRIKVPIIPGSSIKGKIRHLLELEESHITDKGEPKQCENSNDCNICKLFGRGADDKKQGDNLNRLIVRDAYPTKETVENWEEKEDIIEGGEIKGENTINRITSTANPRFIERVPAESIIELELILSLYENDKEDELKNLIEKGINKLKDSYIGGSGSRGYGKVKVEKIKEEERNSEYYMNKRKEE